MHEGLSRQVIWGELSQVEPHMKTQPRLDVSTHEEPIMTLLAQVKDNPNDVLWDQLSEVTAVMLGIEGGNSFMRPMAPQPDPEENTIWFFTKKSSEIFSELDSSKMAHICLVNEDKHFWACVKGRLMEAFDPKVVDRFWSPSIEAWYQDGNL